MKSNDYAFGGATSISNVYVTSIEPGDGGGIRLVGERETLKNITITNFVVERARFGITNNGDADGAILSNGHLLDCSDYGIAVNAHLTHSIFSNIIVRRQDVSTVISFVEQDNKTWTIK